MESHKLEDCTRMIFRLINSVNCVQLAAVVANNEVKSRRNQVKLIFQVLFITIFLMFLSLNYSKMLPLLADPLFSPLLVSKPCPIL